MTKFKPGDRVQHVKFGEGIIPDDGVSVPIDVDAETSVVRFDNAGVRWVPIGSFSKIEPQPKCEHSPLEEEFRMVIRGEFDDFLGQEGDLAVETDREQLVCSIAQRLAEEASLPRIDGEPLQLGDKKFLWPNGEWKDEPVPVDKDQVNGFYEYSGAASPLERAEDSKRVEAIREFVADDENFGSHVFSRKTQKTILDFIDNGSEPLKDETGTVADLPEWRPRRGEWVTTWNPNHYKWCEVGDVGTIVSGDIDEPYYRVLNERLNEEQSWHIKHMRSLEVCTGCGALAATCGPQLWRQQKKCCPDCSHAAAWYEAFAGEPVCNGNCNTVGDLGLGLNEGLNPDVLAERDPNCSVHGEETDKTLRERLEERAQKYGVLTSNGFTLEPHQAEDEFCEYFDSKQQGIKRVLGYAADFESSGDPDAMREAVQDIRKILFGDEN